MGPNREDEPVNSRTCPACARRVPARIDQCRCGYAFPAPAVAAPDAVAEAGEEPRASAVPWALVIVAAAAAGGAAVWFFMKPADANAVATPPAAVQATAGAPAPVPSSPSTPMALPIPVPPAASTDTPAVAAPAALEEIVSAAMAAVVLIDTPTARGSGFFATPDTVVTNAHVVEGNSSVTLKMSDGSSVQARVVRSEPTVDLAIVRVTTPRAGQATLPLASIATARAGQEVIAIGSPLGLLQNTVTRGIVSGIRNAGGVMLIQTDAAINRGNSGGPLLDRYGRVIGVTTLKMAPAGAESLAFAVAADHARPLLEGKPLDRAAPASAAQQANPLASAFGPGQSQTDAMRDQGAAQYERVVQAAARRADSLDDYWQRFRASCRPTVAPNGGDREWFGVWDRPPAINRADAQCAQWLADATKIAAGIHSVMSQADEGARAAGVYPGVQRDLRRKYQMDWNGW
jgi:S1-C subfamily serine protease